MQTLTGLSLKFDIQTRPPAQPTSSLRAAISRFPGKGIPPLGRTTGPCANVELTRMGRFGVFWSLTTLYTYGAPRRDRAAASVLNHQCEDAESGRCLFAFSKTEEVKDHVRLLPETVRLS